jgi:hypothetical protein
MRGPRLGGRNRPNKISSMRKRKVVAAIFRLFGSLALPKMGARRLMPQTLTPRVPAQLDEQLRSRGHFEPRTDPCHKSDIFPVRPEV